MSKTVTAIAKQTLHGSYGLASVGDSITLSEKHAKELEEKGIIFREVEVKYLGYNPENLHLG